MIDLGRKVRILYTGKLEDGTIFDSSDMHEGNPLEFIIGAQQVIPGLDKAVREMNAFEKCTVAIPAEEAYGAYNDSLFHTIPVAEFPNAEKLPIGGYVTLSLDGKRVRVRVDRIEDELIYFDFNHELAGQNLAFDIELIEVFGETGSLIENEKHSEDCACGCTKLQEQLQG